MANLQGACLCGQVKFEITKKVSKLYQCHCSLCQKQSGSLSNTATIIEEKDFSWLTTQSCISSWIKETGFRSDFCSTCGSPVPNPFNETYYWIPAGLIENAQFEIVAHLFTSSKATWDKSITAGAEYETLPELTELFNLLHN